MAFPNFYQGGYYPQYQSAVPDMLSQYKNPYQQMPSTQGSDMLWVLNENEAVSFPVAPNNSVVLWDKNNPTIYVKSVNAQGIPSMRVLDFEERKADVQNVPKNAPKTAFDDMGDKFATKEQIKEITAKIEDLSAKYEELSKPVKVTPKKPKEGEG